MGGTLSARGDWKRGSGGETSYRHQGTWGRWLANSVSGTHPKPQPTFKIMWGGG